VNYTSSNVCFGLQIIISQSGSRLRPWDNNKLNFIEVSFQNVNRIEFAQDRVQWWAFLSRVMNRNLLEHLSTHEMLCQGIGQIINYAFSYLHR
jgi:hypothetical protein